MNNADTPAMPLGDNSNRQPYDGLTKREMFAMAAMQGRAAVPGRVDVEYDCMLAVKYADALLAELAKDTGGAA